MDMLTCYNIIRTYTRIPQHQSLQSRRRIIPFPTIGIYIEKVADKTAGFVKYKADNNIDDMLIMMMTQERQRFLLEKFTY